MTFIQPTFVLFFGVVAACYWAIRHRRAQNLLLLVASFVFYGWTSPRLTLLLFAVTASNYLGALALTRWPRHARLVLTLLVCGSMLNLGVFKYYDWFAAEVAEHLFSADRAEQICAWQIALPLGLSFYTFHNLAYSIDVYRGRFAVRKDPIDYFLYGSYFPQLVAGPIERAGNVIPQLEAARRFVPERVISGLGLAIWGAFKKVALADAIAPYVDLVFGADDPSASLVWAGVLGFTIQVLADFSGYSDMARGLSRMLGIELMENFKHPYLAATPMEFWQRWHISFSTWLRDYVYYPACFSPWVQRWLTIPGTGEWGASANTGRALLITMLASGLWHGSRVNFIAWGLYYAFIGIAYAFLVGKIPLSVRRNGRWRLLTVPIMFGFTLVGMHIFREPSLDRFLAHLALDPFGGDLEHRVLTVAMLGVCAYAAAPLIAALFYERFLHRYLADSLAMPMLCTSSAMLMVLMILATYRSMTGSFIYFQF